MSLKLKRRINKDFDRILLRVIDRSLMQIGRSMGPVIYHRLEMDFIKRIEIPRKTEQFTMCLEQIFGMGAEYLIKMVIVTNLYVTIGEELEEIEAWSFTEYVKDARKKYMRKRLNGNIMAYAKQIDDAKR